MEVTFLLVAGGWIAIGLALHLARGSNVPVLMFGAGGAGSTTEEQQL